MTRSRTEDDIKQALIGVAADAPSPEQLLLSLSARRRREGGSGRSAAGRPELRRVRSWSLPVLVAAMVVAGFVVAPIAIHAGRGQRSSAPPGVSSISVSKGPRFEFPYTIVGSVPGYSFNVQEITADYQFTNIWPLVHTGPANSDAGQSSGVLYTWQNGKFNPALVLKGSVVAVDGRTGYYARTGNVGSTTGPVVDSKARDSMHPTLAWQGRSGDWYVMQWNADQPGLLKTMQALASVIRTDTPSPALTAFEITDLPAAIDERAVIYDALEGPLRYYNTMVELHSSADTKTKLFVSWSGETTTLQQQMAKFGGKSFSTVKLRSGEGWLLKSKLPEDPPSYTLLVPLGDRGLIEVDGFGAAADPSVLEAVAEGLHLAPNLGDPQKWFAATQALPH